jgi:hypothetical protein
MDFAAGVGVFLVTTAFAFAFLPGVIAPFADTDVGDPVSANRVADRLATDELGAPDRPYVLDADRTAAFFADDSALADRLALQSYKSVNVTVVGDDGAPVAVNATVTAAAGPPVPDSADTTVAWRTVTVGVDRTELLVRVW